MAQQIPTPDPADYYIRRVEQARAMAKAAADPSIRGIHMDLAARYALLAAIKPPWRELDR